MRNRTEQQLLLHPKSGRAKYRPAAVYFSVTSWKLQSGCTSRKQKKKAFSLAFVRMCNFSGRRCCKKASIEVCFPGHSMLRVFLSLKSVVFVVVTFSSINFYETKELFLVCCRYGLFNEKIYVIVRKYYDGYLIIFLLYWTSTYSLKEVSNLQLFISRNKSAIFNNFENLL